MPEEGKNEEMKVTLVSFLLFFVQRLTLPLTLCLH